MLRASTCNTPNTKPITTSPVHLDEALTPIPKSSDANISHPCAVTSSQTSKKVYARAFTTYWIPTNTIINIGSASIQTETSNLISNSFPSLALVSISHFTEITTLSSTSTHALHPMLTDKSLPKDSLAPKFVEQSPMSLEIPLVCPLSNNTKDD
nr:hypothetical protein CFP56_71983 [Quercus suber]